jgi:Rad3-related DNA helicase
VGKHRDVVDFKKLREAKAKPKPINPREIFNALPKPPGINDLYASQAEVLDNWFARRTDKDVVVKLHTGGGKTLVALLMAQSVMNEISEPLLYLAPTNQLVGQVLAKSGSMAFPPCHIPRGNRFPVNSTTARACSSAPMRRSLTAAANSVFAAQVNPP